MFEMLLGGENDGIRKFAYSGPGPQEAIAGNSKAGFFGEVLNYALFTDQDLCGELNYFPAVLGNTAWLKFYFDNKILFVAKTHVSLAPTYTDLYNLGAVYGVDDHGPMPLSPGVKQNATAVRNGHSFRIRLLEGAPTEPYEASLTYPNTWSESLKGSEWDSLLRRIVTPRFESVSEKEALAAYAVSSLTTGSSEVNGVELTKTRAVDAAQARFVARSINTASDYSSSITTGRFWRPVLELIPLEDVLPPKDLTLGDFHDNGFIAENLLSAPTVTIQTQSKVSAFSNSLLGL